MERPSDKRRVQELIEEYNRELMNTYRQQTKPPQPREDAWFDEQFPLPDVERDRAALTTTPPGKPTSPSADAAPQFPYTDDDLKGEVPRDNEPIPPPAIGPSPYVGYLRVFAFTGQTAEPLQGATVTVTRKQNGREDLYATTTTDADGFTPVVPLPSVNPALTMRPDIPTPYIPYDIRVDAIGFQPVIYENVPVYGNNYVTQSASMLPLVPGQDPTIPRIYRSGAPTNL